MDILHIKSETQCLYGQRRKLLVRNSPIRPRSCTSYALPRPINRLYSDFLAPLQKHADSST